MKEHWCFFFFYTKFHVQALKSTITGTYEIYSFILQNILKNVFEVCFNATPNHGNCSEMLVAPVLCELESVQALEMPAEVLGPVAGPQSQDEDRTLSGRCRNTVWSLGLEMRIPTGNGRNMACSRKAGVGVPVPEWCDV